MSTWQVGIDEPRPFELLSPRSIEEAMELAARHGRDAALLAGGCDLVDQLKHQWNAPHYLINLKSISGLRNINVTSDHVQVGATSTLGEMERHAQLGRTLPGLVKAVSRVATLQIRNAGTLGGNLLQDSRCPYYRGPWYCYRAGGIQCDAHHGMNQEHAIFGGDRCYTVTPSDTAPVLVALGAEARVASPRGERTLPLSDLFVPPAENILVMHRLAPGDILTGVSIPIVPAQRSTFIKYAMRNAWDFALASVAVVFESDGGKVRNARVILGGVAAVPWRSHDAEQEIEGKPLTDSNIESAARAATLAARPLQQNAYKVALVRKLVRNALKELAS